MSASAAKVVEQEIIRWLERSDYTRFTEVQRLEIETKIWEYGKWCTSGGVSVSGYKPQIPYSGSPPDATWRDGLCGISDEEGLLIHNAIKRLDPQQADVIRRCYVWCQNLESARSAMRIRRDDFYALRKAALMAIKTFLKKSG